MLLVTTKAYEVVINSHTQPLSHPTLVTRNPCHTQPLSHATLVTRNPCHTHWRKRRQEMLLVTTKAYEVVINSHTQPLSHPTLVTRNPCHTQPLSHPLAQKTPRNVTCNHKSLWGSHKLTHATLVTPNPCHTQPLSHATLVTPTGAKDAKKCYL